MPITIKTFSQPPPQHLNSPASSSAGQKPQLVSNIQSLFSSVYSRLSHTMSANNIHVDSLTVSAPVLVPDVTVRNIVTFPSRSVFVDNTQYSSVITKSNYPATQLIKLLIQYIGQDLCSFKYFSDVSFNILKTSQNIWFGINQLIQDISRLEKDEDAWAKYTTYTGAIDPLEE